MFATGRNTGSYAEYLVSESSYVFPLHERLSFAQGAALGTPYFTAYKALIMGANAKPGETVLVHGASGAVGTAAVQIARCSKNQIPTQPLFITCCLLLIAINSA